MPEEVIVDFEGRCAEDSDFDGIKQLLKQLLLRADVDLTKLSELFISQNYVGSVIKQVLDDFPDDTETDDDDFDQVFGITTVVNLTKSNNSPCVDQLKSFLLEKIPPNQKLMTILKESLSSKQIGFCINERFVNISPQIAVPLFEKLMEEVQTACAQGMNYKFDQLVMIVKLYKSLNPDGSVKDETFTNAEEEIFFENSTAFVDYSVQQELDTAVSGNWEESDEKLIPYRRIILFDYEKLPAIITSLKSCLN